MTQAVATNLLIATLLVCPYVCLGHRVGDAAGDGPCCCCDDGQPSPPGGNSPEKRDDTRSDCLCRGAIVGDARVAVPSCAAQAGVAGMIDMTCQTGAIGADVAPSGAPTHACNFRPLAVGRYFCALCGRWRL